MYTSWVIRGLKWATQLFIFSEVMFFLSFFYAFAHLNVVPRFEFGCQSPPPGIKPIHPRALPFFNLCVLLLSSGFLNVATGNLRMGEHYECKFYLVLTLVLRLFFFWAQYHEFRCAWFTICDRCYGRTFYILTGFHGLHVFVGRVVLLINLWRHTEYQFHRGFNVG